MTDVAMTPLEIAQQRIAECRATRSTELDLSGLGLEFIPDEVFDLTWLEKLDVSGDTHSFIHGDIKAIPYEIKKLTALSKFLFSLNKICDLLPLKNVHTLVTLYCSDNQISDLAPLINLNSLVELNCTNNEINDISPLKSLFSLEELHLSFNGISNLQPLSRLHLLTTLHCSTNEISDLSPLQNLFALAELDCSMNEISDISPLKKLPLEILDCSYNQVRDLLTLKSLNLCKQLQVLNMAGNPIYGIPSRVFTRSIYEVSCTDSLRNYWLDLEKGSQQRNRLKVQLVGNGRVGKTTLADALEKKRAPDTHFASTHGITIKDIPITPEDEDEPVTLQLWDFGGQEIYHATHRLFLSDDCLYLLLWAEETEEHPDEIRHPVSYWLESIHDLGRTSPIILIKNQIDRSDKLLGQPDDLHQDLPGVRQIHQSVKISAFNYQRMNALRGAIQDVISEQKHKICLTLPTSWLQVEDALETLKQEHKTIPFAHFKQLCNKAGVTDPTWFAGYLHQTGVLFYREGTFQNQVILDQNWAIEAVYTLFDPTKHRPLIEQMHGRFKGSFTKFFWQDTEENEREIYLDFIRNCGICYEPDHWQNMRNDTAFSDREFVIPALLPESSPAASAWHSHDNDWQLTIEYTFLHRSIIERIILRLGETYQGEPWRNGIFCDTEYGQVLLECSYTERDTSNQGQLDFRLRGQQLEQLTYALRKLVRDVSPHRRYKEFLQQGSDNERQVLPDFEERDDMQSPLEETTSVSKTVKLFISYSHKDEAHRERLDTALKNIQREFPALEYWHDRNLLAGGLVHDEILTQLKEADIVIPMISPDFFASDYCFTHEMEVALKQYEDNKNIVVPVIIRTTPNWHKFQIGNHTALPTDGKPAAKWDDKDEFWADVQTGISQQVERLLSK